MLSRALKIFNRHMVNELSYLLTDNLEYWVEHFSYFAECIRSRLKEKGDIYYAPGTYRVAGFYDDTVIATCRPGSGPTADGRRFCGVL